MDMTIMLAHKVTTGKEQVKIKVSWGIVSIEEAWVMGNITFFYLFLGGGGIG